MKSIYGWTNLLKLYFGLHEIVTKVNVSKCFPCGKGEIYRVDKTQKALHSATSGNHSVLKRKQEKTLKTKEILKLDSGHGYYTVSI